MAALAESPTKAGIANTKYAAAIHTAKKAGVENAVALARPRRPYVEPSEADKQWIVQAMKGMEREEIRLDPSYEQKGTAESAPVTTVKITTSRTILSSLA